MSVFSRKQKTPRIPRNESLKCIPVKNIHVKETRLETGEVLLSYPASLRPWMASLMSKFGGQTDKSLTRKMQLDELGTEVWQLMDGQHSVEQVIQRLSQKYQLQPKETEVAVTHFLRQLGRRGVIGLK
jgi:hypothetical protein